MIHGMHHALDEFHLKKYILKLTRHMKDSAEDARKELCDAIKQGDREEVKLAAGAEDVILSCQQVLNSETHKNGELGKYYDAMQATMSIQDRKKAYLGGKVILF